MLIRNYYLDKCIERSITFSEEEFVKIFKSKYDYNFAGTGTIVRLIFSYLVADYFHEDYLKLKRKTEANVHKLAVLKDVDMYEQYLYIFAALIPFRELFVLKMLGQIDSSTLNFDENYQYLGYTSVLSTETLKNIIDKLTELGIYSD